MDESEQNLAEEIKRIKRVSDMLTSAHSGLKERFARRAMLLDLTTLACSTWLVALVFVDPKIAEHLTPRGFDSHVWIGILGVATFFLSIVQLRVDWKGRADAHKRSCQIYSEVKRDCGYLLESSKTLTKPDCEHVLSRYNLASEVGTAIGEFDFLKQKKRHLQKIEISKMLSAHPGASIVLVRIKIWWRDNKALKGRMS